MNNDIKNILLNYITGKASPEEISIAKNWIGKNSDNEEAFIRLYEDWHKALSSQHVLIDNDKAYKRFTDEQPVNIHKKARNLKKLLSYAALFILVISASLLFYRYKKCQVHTHQIIVEKGKTQEITLPDGTLVFINSGSKLSYNSNFGHTNRDIILDGEARFDIAESSEKLPFIVNAKGFLIRDIGTIFNIKAYSDDQGFEASVLEGEISVEGQLSKEESKPSKVIVSANQILKIKKQNAAKSIATKDVSSKTLAIVELPAENIIAYNNWMDNASIAFDDTSFDDVVRTLNRKFNTNIVLGDSALTKYHYTGTFKNPENIYKVLNVIQETTPITYSSQNKTLIIKYKAN
ncbi:FecR domain-containing protein [Pseudopedobacter sp.]|uniref:FecR family protein n=1 Tax=Pseudopedobacter sp. TaxID=1936787 RepID=UPI003340F9A0